MASAGIYISCPDKRKCHIETTRSSKKGLFDKINKLDKKKYICSMRYGYRLTYMSKLRRLCYHQNKSVNIKYQEYKESLLHKFNFNSSRVSLHYKPRPNYTCPDLYNNLLPESETNSKVFLKKPLFENKRGVTCFYQSRIASTENSIFNALAYPYF